MCKHTHTQGYAVAVNQTVTWVASADWRADFLAPRQISTWQISVWASFSPEPPWPLRNLINPPFSLTPPSEPHKTQNKRKWNHYHRNEYPESYKTYSLSPINIQNRGIKIHCVGSKKYGINSFKNSGVKWEQLCISNCLQMWDIPVKWL